MQVLRWILLLPGAIIALMIGSLAGGIVASVFGQAAADTGSAFAGAFAFVFTGCAIAPAQRRAVGLATASLITLLAFGTVVLSSFTTIEEFATLSGRERVVTPVAQVLGALYAAFICLPILTPGATRESLWREILALGVVVLMLGLLIIVIGAILGLADFGWLGFKAGLVVFLLGAVTWVFPFVAPIFKLSTGLRGADPKP